MLLEELLALLYLVRRRPDDGALDEEHGLGEGVLVVLSVGEERVIGILKLHDALEVPHALEIVAVLDERHPAEAVRDGIADELPSLGGVPAEGLPRHHLGPGVHVHAVDGAVGVVLVRVDDCAEDRIPLHVPGVCDECVARGHDDGVRLVLALREVDELERLAVPAHVQRDLRVNRPLGLAVHELDDVLPEDVVLRADVLRLVADHVTTEGLADVGAEVRHDHVAVGVDGGEVLRSDVVIIEGIVASLLGQPCAEGVLDRPRCYLFLRDDCVR